MHVSRCRYWWCAQCKAVFVKEELSHRVRLYADQDASQVIGTRTCGHCSASYQLRDIYAGHHDVPRQFWGQLQPPVELPQTTPASAPVPQGSVFSSFVAWLLFLLAFAGGVALVGHVLVLPLVARP
ncbi:MAG: hypothetical protein U0840_16730 [Gemmataceae bacterium]